MLKSALFPSASALASLLTLLVATQSHAQSAPGSNSTDPTEPVRSPALLTVPLPGHAQAAAPNDIESSNQNVGESTAVPGDPFGDPPAKPNKVEAGDDNE